MLRRWGDAMLEAILFEAAKSAAELPPGTAATATLHFTIETGEGHAILMIHNRRS